MALQPLDLGKIREGISFEQLLKGLREIFDQDKVDVEQVKDLLASYKSDPRDWRKYAVFDTHRYTRNLVDEGNGKYNLMLLAWGEGMGSSIHDHANAHCFVKVLDGTVRETQYYWPKPGEEQQEMVEKCVNEYDRDLVTYINDTIGLHRVENPSHSEQACTLHLYCPPFQRCQTFDERSGRVRQVRVTFWSRYGERTKEKVPPSCLPDAPPAEPSLSVESLN